MPEISVVIPTYNRLDTLRYVIPSLLAQQIDAEFEVLVCDSMSSDGTKEYLAGVHAEQPNVKHLPGRYTGRAAARNAGIAAATGDVVLFNDADIIASPDLLAQHLKHHRERRDIAVVGWEVQVKSIEDYEYKIAHPAERGSLHPPARKKLSWLYFLTGNASVRREDLLRVGSFDESFTGYGHEDLELGYRLEKAGLTILYEANAVNYHCQDVPHENQVEKMKLAGRSTVRFYRKHPHFAVMANLGMTPLSLGLHGALTKLPWLLGYFDKRAGRSTVRFYRKHPHFAVMANLGMTPVSLGLHGALTKLPWLLGYFDKRAGRSKFARDLVQQYYYVSGIKNALQEKEHQRG